MFEIATRKKLRFETSRGAISVEDLWDLPLTSLSGRPNLDDIALDLHRELRGRAEVVSFVDDTAKPDATLQLRFDIVKHVIETKKRENAEALAAHKKSERKQLLLQALERKQVGEIDAMSMEDLQKAINEL